MFSANGSPNITVHSVFNVTVGKENILTVTTSDPDGDVVIVSLNSTLPPKATWNDDTYTWTPVDMEPVNISYALFYFFCFIMTTITW